MKEKKVVHLSHWKRCSELIKTAATAGWDVTKLDVADIINPVTFYACEPLRSGRSVIAMFDRDDMVRLVNGEAANLKPPTGTVADATGALVASLFHDDKLADKDFLRVALFAGLVNFALTRTAQHGGRERTGISPLRPHSIR